MRLVIDTNVLLVSISSYSKLHWIWKLVTEEKITLIVSTSILNEYEEQFQKHLGKDTTINALEALDHLSNSVKATIYFEWNLIQADPDDNKFVDCAIASRADYIVTHDKHFDILKKIAFPKLNIINSDELKRILNLE